MIKAVIFDMDGLMIDSESLSKICLEKVLSNNNYKYDDNFLNSTIGLNKESFKKLITDTFGNGADIEKINSEFNDEFNTLIETEGLDIKSGLMELLEYLDIHNIKKAVATSTSRNKAEYLLKKVDIFHRFDAFVCGNEVKNGKPNPEVFLKAAEKLGVSKNECIILEDSENGIKAAYAANIPVILIPDIKIPCDEVKKMAYKQLRTLHDVIWLLQMDSTPKLLD